MVKRKKGMEHWPSELISHVFRHLTCEDALSACQVNRAFCEDAIFAIIDPQTHKQTISSRGRFILQCMDKQLCERVEDLTRTDLVQSILVSDTLITVDWWTDVNTPDSYQTIRQIQ